MKEPPASVINTRQAFQQSACQDSGPRENEVGGLCTERAKWPLAPCVGSDAARGERAQWISSTRPGQADRTRRTGKQRIAEISVMGASRAGSSRMAAETETVRAAADGSLPFKTQK